MIPYLYCKNPLGYKSYIFIFNMYISIKILKKTVELEKFANLSLTSI